MNALTRTPLVSCLSLGLATLALQACTFASPVHSTYNEAPDESELTSTTSSGGAAASPAAATASGCEGETMVKVDVSSLTACGDGKGHCYDKAKVPFLGDELAACEGTEVCVPDSMLESAGATPKSCKSVLGAGGCASTVIPQIATNASSLGQDVCDAGEVCAPCTDPTHGNAATPFCSAFGVYDVACVSAAPATGSGSSGSGGDGPATCCNKADGASAGQCISSSAVPEDQRDDTSQQECSGGNACVPAAFVSNTPKTCDGGVYTGVCLDQCFSAYLEYVDSALSSDDCGATEACVPCAILPDNTPGCSK